MGEIKINDILYATSDSSEIIYKDTNIEETLNTVLVCSEDNNSDTNNILDNYLTYGHIVDGLSLDDTNKILSANQGLILNESINVLNTNLANNKTTIEERIDTTNTKITTNTNNISSFTTWKNSLYPVGSVYVTSTNKAPTFGGTWTLIDKKFTPFNSYSTTNGTFFTINSTNTSAHATYVMREDHILRIRSTITTKVAFNDNTFEMGTFDFADLGIGNLTYQTYTIGYSDGGNVMNILNIVNDTGVLNHYDIVGADSLAASSKIQFDVIVPIHYTQMVDAKCNRFYWKRTA